VTHLNFTTLALAVTPFLLGGAIVWFVLFRDTVSRARRKLFLAGILATTLAVAGRFLLGWFFSRAHLNFYDQADTAVGIGGLMFLAAFVGLIGSFFGRSYGRTCACCASLLIGALWWFTSIGSLR